jgi:hypothetical protein
MERGMKNSRMVAFIKGIMSMESQKELANFSGLMDSFIKANGLAV